jgi:ribosomal protein S18 acetylase RimI-like enzyme
MQFGGSTTIRAIEELSIHAWPALESVESDGWVLRFAQGYTRRANSVCPLERGTQTLDEKIGEAERLYRNRGLPCTFKMTSSSEPASLDAALVERGYVQEAPTSVQVATLASTANAAVRVDSSWRAAGTWRTAFHRIGDVPVERQALHDQILSRISLPIACASVVRGEVIVACGLGVLEKDWLGVFDVVVDPAERRRGHGEQLVRGLLDWGCAMGARQAYLQVMLSNAPALALYGKLGFREAYPYWYRVRKEAG